MEASSKKCCKPNSVLWYKSSLQTCGCGSNSHFVNHQANLICFSLAFVFLKLRSTSFMEENWLFYGKKSQVCLPFQLNRKWKGLSCVILMYLCKSILSKGRLIGSNVIIIAGFCVLSTGYDSRKKMLGLKIKLGFHFSYVPLKKLFLNSEFFLWCFKDQTPSKAP